MNYLGIDTETHLIGEEHIFPPLVCVSLSDGEESELLTPWDDPDLFDILRDIFMDDETMKVFAKASYDCQVFLKWDPRLWPAIKHAMEADRIYDVQINEMLNNLASIGSVAMIELPDGTRAKASYKLNSLEMKYLGIDRGDQKVGDDIWRLRYKELDGVPKAEWPVEAVAYALDDAKSLPQIAKLQRPHPQDFHRARTDFALAGFTDVGLKVDPEAVLELDDKVSAAMDASNFPLLVEIGALIPAQPPRPYANGAQEHVEGCTGKPCGCPPKMAAGTKDKKSSNVLREVVALECGEYGIDIPMTESGQKLYYEENGSRVFELSPDDEWWERYPKTVGTSSDVVDSLAAAGSEAMRELAKREEFAKLATTYIPSVVVQDGDSVRIADRLHFPFGPLVESGRTSSFKSSLYPSANGQNVDPRFRTCLVADPGTFLLSVDFAQLELRTLADFCYKTFGYSVARDMLIDGVDLHSFLGAQLAFDLDEEFREVCLEEYGEDNRRGYYECFLAMKEVDLEWFSHYRKFAKPVGLGYPGGLGAKTLVLIAWKDYGFEMTIEMAERAKEIWLLTYPEMVDYFEYIRTKCIDPDHSRADKITGKEKTAYRYETPLGLVRANCAYTGASNGFGEQSYAADGAMLVIWAIFCECQDSSSILYKCKPVDFIHDEILMLIHGGANTTKIAKRVCEVMEEAMSQVVTEVPIVAEPALMERWYKKAEPVWEDGRLIPWRPKEKENSHAVA